MTNHKKVKKMQKIVLAAAFAGSLTMSAIPVSAAADEQNVSVILDSARQSYEQPPVVADGSVLVPLRGIFEKLGARIDWDEATGTVFGYKYLPGGSLSVQLTVGKNTAWINGKSTTLAVPAKVVGGSTLVPLRFVGEALGANVKWDNATSTVYIESAKVTQEVPQQSVYVSTDKGLINGYTNGTTSEEILLAKLREAIANLKVKQNNDVEDMPAYREIMFPLAVIDRKIAYDTWNDADGLYNALKEAIPLLGYPITIPESWKYAMYWGQVDKSNIEQDTLNIKRMFAIAEKLKNRVGGETEKKSSGTEIKVRYGKHNYGSNSQEEYDTVMNIVHEAIKEFDRVEMPQYFDEYMAGARGSRDQERSERNVRLVQLDGAFDELVAAKISKASIEHAYKTMTIAGDLIRGIGDPSDASPRSAFDALIRRASDCDSDANVYSAVFDAMGYNTMIIATPGHAQMFVEIEGHWWAPVAGSFGMLDHERFKTDRSVSVYTQPTFGKVR